MAFLQGLGDDQWKGVGTGRTEDLKCGREQGGTTEASARNYVSQYKGPGFGECEKGNEKMGELREEIENTRIRR